MTFQSWFCIFYGLRQMYDDMYYSIIQSSFTALKILCALPTLRSLPSTLATMNIFIVSIALLLPECHIVRII